LAIGKAQDLVRKTGDLSVPLSLRNAPTKLMKDLDYGKEYQYSHNYPNNFVDQEFMPDEISGTKLYEPGENQRENQFKEILKNRWKNRYNY
jgi:putative ATPase